MVPAITTGTIWEQLVIYLIDWLIITAVLITTVKKM